MKRKQQSGAETERRIVELTAIIRFDPISLVDASDQLKRLQDLPAEVRLALDDVDCDPISGRIRRATFKDKVAAAEEFLRLCGRDKEPEIVALLKAARLNQQRVAAILKAVKEMRDTEAPPGKVN